MTESSGSTQRTTIGWDLHCHTVYSDGTKTPTELMADAQLSGLHGVAITDHDTTEGWDEALEASKASDMPLILGTEVTAEFGTVSVHVLGFNYDRTNRRLMDLFEKTRQKRIQRAKSMVSLLSEDFPITWESVLLQIKKGSKTTVGRPHMADALVAAGVYPNRSEAFAGAVSASSKYYIPTASPSAMEVVDAIREAGGISVIAHPADRGRNAILLSDRQIELLVREGLGGLEVWNRGNDDAEHARLLRLACRFDLLVTGGSDWHGDGKPNRLGENVTQDAVAHEIIRRGVHKNVSVS